MKSSCFIDNNKYMPVCFNKQWSTLIIQHNSSFRKIMDYSQLLFWPGQEEPECKGLSAVDGDTIHSQVMQFMRRRRRRTSPDRFLYLFAGIGRHLLMVNKEHHTHASSENTCSNCLENNVLKGQNKDLSIEMAHTVACSIHSTAFNLLRKPSMFSYKKSCQLTHTFRQ